MTGFARETAAGFGHTITLEQLALLAEFGDDAGAVGRIMTEICNGRSGQHAAERIRQERAEAAEHERLVVQLIADGYAVTTEVPPAAHMLHFLARDGRELTPGEHAGCPGRAVYFSACSPLVPRHFCTDPEGNGHASRYQPASLPDLSPAGGTSAGTLSGAGAGSSPAPDPGRRLVIEGNRAWIAAATVRRRWLSGTLFQRRTAPKETVAFVTGQLLSMPAPLRDALTAAPRSAVFTEIMGGAVKPAEVSGWPAARLPLALLAVIAAVYEERMGGDAGRETWRTGRPCSRCPRDDAGAWFRFLASAGYELSPIEQAVADSVPYAGDQPGAALTAAGEPGDAPGDRGGAGNDGTGAEPTGKPAEAGETPAV